MSNKYFENIIFLTANWYFQSKTSVFVVQNFLSIT